MSRAATLCPSHVSSTSTSSSATAAAADVPSPAAFAAADSPPSLRGYFFTTGSVQSWPSTHSAPRSSNACRT